MAPDIDFDRVERVSFFVGSFFATGFYGAVATVPAFVLIRSRRSFAHAQLYLLRSCRRVGCIGVRFTAATFRRRWKTRQTSRRSNTRCCSRYGGQDFRRHRLLADRRAQGRGLPRKLIFWSGRRDLNSRPPVPQTGALTGLRHAPTGTARTIGMRPWQRNNRTKSTDCPRLSDELTDCARLGRT